MSATNTKAEFLGSVRYPDVVSRSRPVRRGEDYVVGSQYWNAYWCYEYEVVAMTGEFLVTVRELSTGETWSHCTGLDRRDRVLS